MSKIKIDDIKSVIEPDGWKLISQEYTNLDTPMEFVCSEGHHIFLPWKKIRTQRECPICKENAYLNTSQEIKTKPKNVTRTLALDQATRVTGWAIFDNADLVQYGVFKVDDDNEVYRTHAVKEWLASMIISWKPDIVGIEGIQYQDQSAGHKMGVTVFQTLARLQGVLLDTCFSAKVNAEICPTNTWRHQCGVKGVSRADRKKSMQLLVKKWYDISVSDDESDAIGIGRYLSTKVEKQTKVEDWES